MERHAFNGVIWVSWHQNDEQTFCILMKQEMMGWT